MRRGFAGLWLLCGSLLTAGEGPSIGLMVGFPAGTPADVQEEFRRETEQTLGPAGVDLIWRDLDNSPSNESFTRLVMVRFTGECMPLAASASDRSKTLGRTHISDGHVMPFVEVDCSNVRRAMYGNGLSGGPFLLARALGRALGRVAAHELHHVLTASRLHDKHGIMRPEFRQGELSGNSLSFSADSLRRLKSSLRKVGTAQPRSLEAVD